MGGAPNRNVGLLGSVVVDEGSLEGNEAGVDVVEMVGVTFIDFNFDFGITALLDRLIEDEESWEDDEAEVDVVTIAFVDRLVEDEK